MKKLLGLVVVLFMAVGMSFGQATTGALQGTVKDPTGAVVANAKVTVTTPTLVGVKTTTTDDKGYYRFANLPGGAYVLTVEATGFETLKRTDLVIEVGHNPTIDLALAVGSKNSVVEVSAENPAIDVTSVTTQTNITQDVINYVPRGTSFQSVIQFAPAASNEPLMGNTMTNGTGSTSPGNGSNGGSFGYSVAGGSDSENSYLVEGQETANLIGGYSHTNVPFDFIQDVNVTTSGIQAEYGGALGGVVNVIMKKGTNRYHGSAFLTFENQGLDAGPSATSLYDNNSSQSQNNWTGYATPCSETVTSLCGTYSGVSDALYQSYQPVKDKHSELLPGFTLGGPLLPMFSSMNDRLFFFVGFNPELLRYERFINYGASNGGILPFSQNTNTYYTVARIDAQATTKVRVFASWLYQFQKQHGESFPNPDSTTGQLNPATGCFSAETATLGCTSAGTDPSVFAHTLGYSAPNVTFNTGADITLAHNIVTTTRFGYYFENYHDFGFPTGGYVDSFITNGVGGVDTNGQPLPASFQKPAGYLSGAVDQLTSYNSNKAIQFDQDVAWYKGTSWGIHNFKFGYQLSRDSNFLNQAYNEPVVNVYPGAGNAYTQATDPVAAANCATIQAANGAPDCQGIYGYGLMYDIGTGGKAISYDQGIYVQDSWTVGRGLTFDLGVRAEKENLPGEVEGPGVPPNPIDFNWGSKIAPRLGFAWDVFNNGKMKAFGSYGVFYDQMKLNLAISSFGGAYWNNCAYAIDNPDLSVFVPAFNSVHRTCSGNDASSEGNFAGGTTPAGLSFIENVNFRASIATCSTCNPYEEAVAPNLKPYQQHEDVAGVDYQISNSMAFEIRYDRRRLDHVIEDSAIYDPAIGETFVIVNPGQGVDTTFTGFCQFLYATDDSGCISPTGAYPPNQSIAAARSYDGLEVRLNKALSNHWMGMFSYTYSRFRGNYTGLTSSDIADGGVGGRNAPNNSRSFDEPYFQYNANGGSSSGLLPTDRPNKLKGYAYYEMKYSRFTTDLGLFQTVYEGSPNTTYMDVGASYNAYPVDVYHRGQWANISQDQTTGVVTASLPYTYRNPWYIQSDFNVNQAFALSEGKALSFTATFSNLFNQHVVTAVNEQVDTPYTGNQSLQPGGYSAGDGIPFYAAAMTPYRYSISDMLNGLNIGAGGANDNGTLNSQGGPITVSSLYGTPLHYQLPRTIRLSLKFTF